MIGKTLCFFALAAFLGSTRSELVMSVLPEEVIPGITPTFTLRCSAAEVEPSVVSLQLKRATQGSSRHIYQTLATLNATAVNSSVKTSGLPGMTANGMLGRVGFEVMPFLEITIRNPTVNDLGTYVCDGMMVGELGQAVPLSSFISVTTSDPVSDRLLHLLYLLRTQLQSITGQMTSLQTDLSQMHQHGRGQQEGEKSTDTGRGGGRDLPAATIVHIHEYDNTSYVLWRGGPFVMEDAMEACSRAGMYLTEINNEAEFRQVVQGLGAHVSTGSSVLLGGQRMDQWLWPHSGSMIDYMRGINAERRGACLSMKKVSDYRMVMDVVNCDDRFRYYLCSVDESILHWFE